MNKFSIAVQKVGKIVRQSFFIYLTILIFSTKGIAADNPPDKASFDAAPPVITYTPLTSTCSSAGRTLTATIVDAGDGVPTAGLGRPVLYWRINSGALNPSPGTSIGANQFNFALGAGAPPGSLVSYYIVAQDNSGNVIASPSTGAGGYTTSPPAAATEPTTPSFYVIQNTLAGIYTVGTGGAQNYLNITDAVNAYNNSCLAGAVTFLLMDASYPSEIFPITINNPGASSVNTLTIKPNTGVNSTLTGSSPEAIFKFNGADYVTLDGSNAGTATRNFTITNTNTGINSVVIWVASASASNPATNDSIKNCTIVGSASTTTLAGIVSSSGVTVGSPAEAANANNTYLNNVINTSYYGIIAMGPAGNESGTVISGNSLGSGQAPKKLGYRGILVSNQTNVLVFNNTVAGVLSSFGLGSDTEPTSGITLSGSITGGSVSSNHINDIKNSNTSGWHSYGISLQASNAATGTKIYNNFLFNIGGYGDDDVVAENGHGIAILTGGGYGIFFNSINLYVNQMPIAGHGACIFIGTAVSGTIDIRNNILSNKRTSGTRYAIYSSLPNTVFSNINYNDYYSTEFVGFLTVPRATIGAWQTATGADGNSVATNPIFISNIDLHLNLISPLNDQGIPISGITTDIDTDTRNPAPDIGADEFTPPPCTNNLGGTVSASNTTVCDAGAVILSSTGFSYGLGIAYQWQYSTDNVTWNPLPGETNPTSANPPAITVTTWYRLRVTCNNGTPGASNSLQVTVYNPQVLSTTPGSRCGPGTVNLAATGTPTTNIEWYATPTGGAPLYTGSPFTTPSLTSTTTFYAQSTYPGSSGSVGPSAPLTPLTITSTQYTPWQVYFTVLQATTLLTIDVYPLAIGEASTIDVYRGPIATPTLIASVPYTTTVGGGATAQVIPMNVPLPVGTDFFLYATPTTANPTGLPPAGLRRDISGAAYPYNSTDIQITGNEFNSDYYMCYYRWKFSNGCGSSPRTAVVATVSASVPISVSVTPAAICNGDSSVLSATSADPNYIYTWNPGNLSGGTITVSPGTSTTYSVTAVDGACNTNGSVSVIVNAAPSPVTIAPADSVTKCASSPAQLLTASGGAVTGATILGENFNSGTPGTSAAPPGGWTIANTSTGQVIANAAWTYRPNGYVYKGVTFKSNDSSQFYLTNSDAQGTNSGNVARTNLKSPVFSLAGFTSANLNFYHFFSSFGGDSVMVEYSPNGTTGWVRIWLHTTSRGTSTNFENVNISLDPYIGVTANYLRFRYYAPAGFYWAIDNIKITGQNSSTSFVWSPIGGLFIDAAANTAYTGTTTPTVYAKPSVTTSYIATATAANGCKKSDTIKVIVRSLTGVISGGGNTCPLGPATISVSFTGTGPWNFTYSDGTVTYPVTGIASSPYTFTVNPAVTTTYTLTALSDANCTAAPGNLSGSATVTVSATTVSTWLGINNDWMDPVNWCGGVPVITRDAVIPAGTPFYPVITNALPVAKGVSIASGANITIDPPGTLSFMGIFINNGTLTNNGKLILNGSTAQSFPGGTTGLIAAMNNIEVNNPAGATINRRVMLTGTLKPKSGNITIGDSIILHSDASSTARVDTVQGTISYTGAGKFIVERFISSASKVGWRFLSAPINGVQTINQAWQEGQATGDSISTGYGMQIVGPASAGPGFDINTTSPSVKKYNPPTNAWVSIPGTTGAISATDGYMAFVRGDRDANVFGEQSATTLRMAGPIKTGNIGPLSTPNPGTFISVGNPYPSAIDFLATTRVGLQNVYYLWDPKLNTYGGYQTFAGPGYVASPGGGSYTSGNKFIESGMAFFVISTAGAAPHSITITENSKVGGSNQVARAADLGKNLRTNLFLVSGGTTSLYDGVRVDFDAAYSNAVNDDDALKLNNFGENLGLMREEKAISVERRAEIVDTDTLYYAFGQLRQQEYQLEFTPEHLAAPGLTAFLEDAYLNTTTVISLDNVSMVNFTVNADAGSYAAERFRLVFKQLAIVPVSFTGVWARKQNKDILVGWKVENENNMDHYEIEKSVDGRSFTKAGTEAARGNGGASMQYSWLDKGAFSGDNFYRIRSVGVGNEVKLSSIVKVNIAGEDANIVVYPNPVKNGLMGISMNNQPEGEYAVKIFNQKGQLMASENFQSAGISTKIVVDVSHSMSARGIYHVEIALLRGAKKGRKFMENVMFD